MQIKNKKFKVKKTRIGSAVVIEQNGKVLLAKRKYEPLKDYWTFPGGGIKFGESVEQAAKREMMEELGIKIELQEFIGFFEYIKNDMHRLVLFNKAKIVGGEPIPNDDVADIMWIEPEKLKEMEKVAYSVFETLEKMGKVKIGEFKKSKGE